RLRSLRGVSGKCGADGFETVGAAADGFAMFGNRRLELAPLGLPRRVTAAVLDHMILERRAEVAFADKQPLGPVARAQAFNCEVSILADEFEREQVLPVGKTRVQRSKRAIGRAKQRHSVVVQRLFAEIA